MRRIVLYLLVLIASQSCVAQKNKNMKTNDRFDYEYYQRKIGKDKIDCEVYREPDGTLVEIFISHDENSVYMIEPMTFVEHIRNYYKNNILKKEGYFFYCSSVKVGPWKEYDEKGNLIKETDESAKFEKLAMKPIDVLRWMEKQGWLNLTTGEGQQSYFSNNPFRISFVPNNKSNYKGNTHAKWCINKNEMYGYETFLLDAETKELIYQGKTFMEE